MTTIELNVSDDIIKVSGTELIKNYLEEQLEYLKLQSIADNISKSMSESGVDFEAEFKKAKKEAWVEYKDKYLKDIIHE